MEENDISIQITDLTNLRMVSKYQWERRTIYKIPAWITDNKNSYRPLVVSFGPYYCTDENLKPMEKHKDRVLQHFLERSGNSLENCISSLRSVEQDLKDAYDSLSPQQDTYEFLKLMVRDGCFMLEILQYSIQSQIYYAPNDPVFSEHGRLQVMPHIKRDMLKLENQLPMVVLQKLLEVKYGKDQDEEDVNKLVFKFLVPLGNKFKPLGKCNHVLDLYRKILLEQPPPELQDMRCEESYEVNRPVSKLQDLYRQILLGQRASKPQPELQPMRYEEGYEVIRPVSELQEAGISIENVKSRSLRKVTFDIEKGILRLPSFTVDDTTEALFLNLMAYERFHAGIGNQISDFLLFMDNMVNDAKDISLLRKKGIIENAYGSDEAAAQLFNSITKDVSLDRNNSLAKVHSDVNDYCKQKWHRWRADCCQKYFRSPWSSASLAGAIILFVLTVTQTIYTIVDFYR